MSTPKHLPARHWPAADVEAFKAAYAPGDIFEDDCGPGAHLSAGTRCMIETAYGRWLGYLRSHRPSSYRLPPAGRITPTVVRAYVDALDSHLESMSVVIYVDGLYKAARLLAPTVDWSWLKAIRGRLTARATPLDRFDRLVPTWQILDLGIELMDQAMVLPPDPHHRRELRFRDGLLLSTLSLWVIRRRSIAALTLTRHVIQDEDGITLLLHPEDTKAKRHETFRVPDLLAPYVIHYLTEIRPRIPGADMHDGLWASNIGTPLSGTQIYAVVRRHIKSAFGKSMGLHDIRRSAATFLAMDAPELASLIPSVMQHVGDGTSDKHYILARSITASRRHTETICKLRNTSRLMYKAPKGGKP